MQRCPVCDQEVGPGERIECSFSKAGTWCNHAGWVLVTGASRDDPPILDGERNRSTVAAPRPSWSPPA